MTTRQRIFTIIYVPLSVAVAIWLTLFASCKTEQKLADKCIKAHDKVEAKYTTKSDVDTAGVHWSATRHPVKVGAGTVTYIKGDSVTITDTFSTTHTDTFNNVQIVTNTITKRVYVHDTVKYRDTLEDTRAITLQSAEITGLRSDNTKAWDEASKAKIAQKDAEIKTAKRGWYILWLILALAVSVYFNVRPSVAGIIGRVKDWRK